MSSFTHSPLVFLSMSLHFTSTRLPPSYFPKFHFYQATTFIFLQANTQSFSNLCPNNLNLPRFTASLKNPERLYNCSLHFLSSVLFRLGSPANFNALFLSSDNSLRFGNVQLLHSGFYQCLAVNSVGESYGVASLVVRQTYDSVTSTGQFGDSVQKVAPPGRLGVSGFKNV